MSDDHEPAPDALPNAQTHRSQPDLEALARETGCAVELLRTFAGISDRANDHLFSAESARKALAAVKAPRDNT